MSGSLVFVIHGSVFDKNKRGRGGNVQHFRETAVRKGGELGHAKIAVIFKLCLFAR